MACSTAPPSQPVSVEEISRRERGIGAFLGDDLSRLLKVRRDVEVTIHLRDLAKHLMATSSDLATAPIGVFLFDVSGGAPLSFGVPGVRLYLSVELLKSCRFENEIAAAMASELAILERGVLFDNLSALIGGDEWTEAEVRKRLPAQVNYFGDAGLMNVSREARLGALVRSVGILYGSGFDPRGVLGLLEIFRKSQDQTVNNEGFQAEAIEAVREAINAHPPLRNPVVRSTEYLKVLKRIERL